MSVPPRGGPLACGALGGFDRDRVLRAAAASGRQLRVVHEDSDSILLLDRPPIEWSGGGQRGLGWIEADLWRRGATPGWEEAARRGLAGLVLDGRRRFLHSSLNGLARLYWTEGRGATYFSSRLEPLARSFPERLSVDWDAWAAIVALRYPLGESTPFAEIRRLRPFATVQRRLRRGRVRAPAWEWAEIEPGESLEGAADAVVETLRESLSRLPSGIVCPLSGGRDSRMVFSALAAEGRASVAITVDDDEGEELEQRLAAAVAADFGVPHECLAGEPTGFRADWRERALRVEHQFVDHPWLVPVARRVDGLATPVPDGFAIDIFVQSERHFNTAETLDNRQPREATLALFDALRRYGHGEAALVPELHVPIASRAREQFLAAARPFEGHPSQNLLSTYATRSWRGVGTYPTGLLGAHAQVLAPGGTDPVVRAALSADQRSKDDGRLYAAVYERLAPAAGRLPSTSDTPRSGPRLPRRWLSEPALAFYRETLAEGPLAEHLGPELRGWLEDPAAAELDGGLRLGMEAVCLLHSWWAEYRDVLREADPRALAG